MKPIEHGDGFFISRFSRMAVGYVLGSKPAKTKSGTAAQVLKTVSCPKCGQTAWQLSKGQYVHESITRLQKDNEPRVEVIVSCKLTKHEQEVVRGGGTITS